MTKAHGSTLYLGSKDMDLLVSLLDARLGKLLNCGLGHDDPDVSQAIKLRGKLRGKQYHPTRKK